MEKKETANIVVSKRSGGILLSLYFVCVISFWCVGELLFDPDTSNQGFWVRSELFYVRLIWFELLFTFAWFGAFIEPIKEIFNRPRQIGGVPVAIAASICNAALLSIVMLVAWLFLPRERFYDNLPVAIQIIIVVVCLFKIVLLRIAGAAQLAGMDTIPVDIKSPEQLSAMLTICLKQPIVEDKYLKTLECCKNKIDHSLPRVGKIAKSSEYKQLAEKTEELYEALMDANYDHVGKMVSDVEKLIDPAIQSCKR